MNLCWVYKSCLSDLDSSFGMHNVHKRAKVTINAIHLPNHEHRFSKQTTVQKIELVRMTC